jgi:hypothetical protein
MPQAMPEVFASGLDEQSHESNPIGKLVFFKSVQTERKNL